MGCLISVDLAADLLDGSVTSMSAAAVRVRIRKWVVNTDGGVCADFGGLYIFTSLILVAFYCGIIEWWVFANGLAVEAVKIVYAAIV